MAMVLALGVLYSGSSIRRVFSSFDGHYYLTEHRLPGHSVWQFDIQDDRLTNIQPLY